MFQARYILILCLFVTFIFFNFSFAEVVKTQEEKRANYVLTNMQQDYTTCYIFYKILCWNQQIVTFVSEKIL